MKLNTHTTTHVTTLEPKQGWKKSDPRCRSDCCCLGTPQTPFNPTLHFPVDWVILQLFVTGGLRQFDWKRLEIPFLSVRLWSTTKTNSIISRGNVSPKLMWPSWKSSYLCEVRMRVREERRQGLCFLVTSLLPPPPPPRLPQKLLVQMWVHHYAVQTSASDQIWHPVISSSLLLWVTAPAGTNRFPASVDSFKWNVCLMLRWNLSPEPTAHTHQENHSFFWCILFHHSSLINGFFFHFVFPFWQKY